MVQIDDLARTALHGDPLELRAITQDWLYATPDINTAPPPASDDPDIRAVAAALVELFAERRFQSPPAWTASMGRMRAPTFLVRSALNMKHLRAQCEHESPEPLRRRGLFAPADFLSFV